MKIVEFGYRFGSSIMCDDFSTTLQNAIELFDKYRTIDGGFFIINQRVYDIVGNDEEMSFLRKTIIQFYNDTSVKACSCCGRPI